MNNFSIPLEVTQSSHIKMAGSRFTPPIGTRHMKNLGLASQIGIRTASTAHSFMMKSTGLKWTRNILGTNIAAMR